MTPTLAFLASEGGGGFNPLDLHGIGGFFWTLVIFVVAVIPIWIVVMGPVTKALLARDAKASEAIASAEKASRDALDAKAAVENKLRAAEAEAAKIVDAARGRGEAVERQLKEQAARDAAAMLDRAKAEIRGEQERAIATIRREVVDVSLNAAGKVLARKVDGQDDRRLVEELVSTAAKGGRA